MRLGNRERRVTSLNRTYAWVRTMAEPKTVASSMVTPTETLNFEEQSSTRTPDAAVVQPGLPFDAFIEEAFQQLMQRDPEWATAESVAEQVEADETRLTDFSSEGIRQTQELQ